MTGLQKMVEWLEIEYKYNRKKFMETQEMCYAVAESHFEICLNNANTLLEEEAHKPPVNDMIAKPTPTEDKPTAPASLVDFRNKVKSIFEDIMLNEDTEYGDAESVAVAIGELLQDTPTESIAEEPLACLAGRKGWFVVDQYVCKQGETSIGLRPQGQDGFAKVLHGPTYALAEQSARTYLMGLDDVKGRD